MTRWFVTLIVLLLGVGGAIAAGAQTGYDGGKLIEFGFDIPTTAQLRANTAQMEQAPFDGVVLSGVGWNGNTRVDCAGDFWGGVKFTQGMFFTTVNDLQATKFHHFTDNFLRIGVTPGNVDWFDDAGWSTIVGNAAVASWICKAGNLKGIFFDTEQYQGKPFSYQAQPQMASHTFAQYLVEARKRGQAFGKALTRWKTNAYLMLTYGSSYMTAVDATAQPYNSFGLIPAFIDGILDGANPHSVIADGMEFAYGAKTNADYDAFNQAFGQSREFSVNPGFYDVRLLFGFGFWMDYAWQTYSWDPVNSANNYYSPAALTAGLQAALRGTTRYVWLYSEQINWWTGQGLSPAYIQAVAAARKP